MVLFFWSDHVYIRPELPTVADDYFEEIVLLPAQTMNIKSSDTSIPLISSYHTNSFPTKRTGLTSHVLLTRHAPGSSLTPLHQELAPPDTGG